MRFRSRSRYALFVVLLGLGWSLRAACAQSPASKTDAEIKTEEAQALQLYNAQNFVAALPLYEDLHAQRPQSLAYQERLAFCVLANSPRGAAGDAGRARAKHLLLALQAAGDNSNLLQILLEQIKAGEDAPVAAPVPGQEWVDKGEKAFTSGDLPGALDDYKKALEINPKLYGAALFAGDAEYKRKHYAEAGTWFAKAIEIDPTIETAYRYWGDDLEAAGEHKRAEDEFIQGVLAQPYQRAPRVGLKQWADRNHMRVVPPPIKLPAEAAAGKNGGMNITVDSSKKDDPEMPANLVYSMNSALWQGEKFRKTFPNEKTYRHSLAEEMDGIHTMLSVIKAGKIAPDKLSPSTRLLMELDGKGMLECWILLDNPDQGVAKDYVAYRDGHRELMAKYIAEYDLHPM